MYKWFQQKIEGNIFQRLWIKFWNKRMRNLFTCPNCGKGDLANLHGYFECPKCKHEFK